MPFGSSHTSATTPGYRLLAVLCNEELPHWTPYQIRHAALTRIRRAKGEEAAAVIGGHSKKSMTDHYTVEAIRDLALNIAAEVG